MIGQRIEFVSNEVHLIFKKLLDKTDIIRLFNKMNKINLIFICVLVLSFSKAQTPTFQWAKNFDGTSSTCVPYGIKSDNSGNVYTTGGFIGNIDFDPGIGTNIFNSFGVWDIFVSKLDASGDFVWAKQIGGTSSEQGFSITCDNSGNVYVTGYFLGTVDFDPGPGTYTLSSLPTNTTENCFILKLNASGNFVWVKHFASYRANSITLDNSGNVYTTGDFTGTVDFDPGIGNFFLTAYASSSYYDGFISKLDNNGNFIWAKNIGGSCGTCAVDPGSIKVDPSGNVYTTGMFFGGSVDFDPGVSTFTLNQTGGTVFISKLNVSGNFVWAKQIQGYRGNAMALDGSGNVYTIGDFVTSGDFDPGTGVFIMTPVVNPLGSKNAFISKLDSLGDFVWAKQISTLSPTYGKSISINSLKKVCVTGENSVSQFSRGIFINLLDSLGNTLWTGQFNSNSTSNRGSAIEIDPIGNIYNAGYFAGVMDFDPGSNSYTLSASSVSGYVLKLGSSSLNSDFLPAENKSTFCVYPNPNNGLFSIETKINTSIVIINVLGEEILHETVFSGNHKVDIQNHPAGIYFLKVFKNDFQRTYKVIKE